MRCVWCDSEYTFTGGDHFTIDDLMNRVSAIGCNLVEVTGGEPLAQKEAFALITRLCDDGYEVLVETGGYVSTAAVDQRAKLILDVKCPASGESSRNYWPNLDRLRADKDEIKFVVANRDDWDFAREVTERYQLEKRSHAVLISPAWGEVDLKELANWITIVGSTCASSCRCTNTSGVLRPGVFDVLKLEPALASRQSKWREALYSL